MRRIIIMLCLCFFCLVGCKKEKVQTEETEEAAQTEISIEDSDGGCGGTPVDYHNEICVIEDCLYYCDPDRNAALYAYNMKTKEEVCVTEQSGKLLKTQRGYFYLSGDFVYQVDGLEVTLFCELPEGGEFIGFSQNKIVWAKREHYTEILRDGTPFERFARQSIWWQEMEEEQAVFQISTEASEQLFYISPEQGQVNGVGVATEGIYFDLCKEASSICGLHYLTYETRKVEFVLASELIMTMHFENDLALVYGSDTTGYDCWFLIDTKTQEVQKLRNSEGSDYALFHEGKVYYGGKAVWCYTPENDTYEVLSADRYSDLDYSEAALYKNYLIMRHGYEYSFYVLDMETREIKPVSD